MALIPGWAKALVVAAIVAAIAYAGWSIRSTYAERDSLKTTVAAQAETLKLAAKVTTVTSEVMSARVQSAASIKAKAKDVQVEIHKRLAGGKCSLPGDWRVLHDSAADGETPPPTSGTDGPTVTAEEAASTVADNYETYHDTADRLTKLQQWIQGVTE